MPSQHTTITVMPGPARPLSNGEATAVRIRNLNGASIDIQVTNTNVEPTSRDGALPLAVGETMVADLALAALFPGVGPGPFFVWAFASTATVVSVSHA